MQALLHFYIIFTNVKPLFVKIVNKNLPRLWGGGGKGGGGLSGGGLPAWFGKRH
jgi:hypothetical protein